MSKTVKVTYDSQSLKTTITVDGKPFDTSRIDGKEIADWAYPFMMRKVKWNGFYDEMVEALGGEKAFDLIFEGDESALDELKEAWEDAPVNIISESESGNVVNISYDENSLSTTITVNGKPFDTSRINGKEIADWVYPFMMRKVKWNGIFEELANAVGSDKYTIQFSGSNDAMKELMEECPDNVDIKVQSDISVSHKELFDKIDRIASLMLAEAIKEQNGEESEILSELEELIKSITDSDFELLSSFENSNDMKVDFIMSMAGDENEACMDLLKQSADNDYAPACFMIAFSLVSDENANDDNWKDFLYYIKKAFDNGLTNYVASENLQTFLSDGLNDLDIDNASKLKEIMIENGIEVSSEYNEGTALEDQAQRLDNEGKYKQSLQLRLKAADLGNVIAISNIGWHYQYGKGVEQNYAEALKWYKKAAEQGNAWSENKVGEFYYYGYGVEEDNNKAFKWFTKAAEQGNAIAQSNLGECYYYGYGVEEDNNKAFKLFEKAAVEGILNAQANLGECYYGGFGVNTDYSKAFEWFIKAGEQGNRKAQYYLGECYNNGFGVNQDYDQAFEWYTKAAEQGHEKAQIALSQFSQQSTLQIKSEPGLLSSAFQKGKEFVQSDKGKAFLQGAANFLGGVLEGRAQAKQYFDSHDYYYDDEY